MAEYIEREAVLELLTNRDVVINPHDEVAYIKGDVECLPAANVRPVVLCKNCKHRQHDEIFGESWCNGHRVLDDWFCADGEKREES